MLVVKLFIRVLDKLVSERLSSIRKYSALLRGVFDHFDKLDLNQVRKVFSLMTSLLLKKSAKDSVIHDDIFLIIKKQMASKHERCEKIAVSASFSVITKVHEMMSQHGEDSYTQQMSAEIVELLDVAFQFVKASQRNLSIYFEEMAGFIQTISTSGYSVPLVVEKVVEDVESFHRMFFSKISSPQSMAPKLCLEIECQTQFNLTEHYDFALDLPKICLSEDCTKRSSCKTVQLALPSFVKCFWALKSIASSPRKSNPKSLPRSLLSLLECPLIFPNISFNDIQSSGIILTLSPKQIDFLIDCNLLAANFFREILNLSAGFGSDQALKNRSVFKSLSSRLTLLNTTQNRFLQLIRLAPFYSVPGIQSPVWLPESNSMGQSCLPILPHQIVASKKASKAKTKTAGRKRKLDNGGSQDEEDVDSTLSEGTTQDQKVANMSRCVLTAPGCSSMDSG